MSDDEEDEDDDEEEGDEGEGEDLRTPSVPETSTGRRSRPKKEPAYHSPQQFARLLGAVADATTASIEKEKQANKAVHRGFDRVEKLHDRIGDLREEIAKLKSEKEGQAVAEAKANAEAEQTKQRVQMALQALKTVGDLGTQFIDLQKLNAGGDGSGAVFAQEMFAATSRLFAELQKKAPAVYEAIGKACPAEFARLEVVGEAYAQSRPKKKSADA